MRYLRSLTVAATLVLTVLTPATALTAVVEVNEESWYTNVKATAFGGASLTRYYAPLPVFFEGWKSSPRDEIVDWVWDFGDGSPLFHGFNAAHVYETAGNFTCVLTVVDKQGQTAQTSIPIEALPRTGTTYYVDAVNGDDANAGTSTAAPWRSAAKAFTGMNNKFYKPGDRVLFKRGQTFPMEAGLVKPSYSGAAGYGYYFGAYGEGARPIIKHVGASGAELFKIGCNDLGFFGMMDLEFDCISPELTAEGKSIISSFFIVTGRACNVFFLRCHSHHHFNGIGFNGDYLTRRITNAYVIDCQLNDAIGVDAMHLYTKSSRYANIGSTFDMSDDHVGYHSYLNKAIFSGNVYTRWAFGRLAIRSCGIGDDTTPTNNVHIINNRFIGWIDPKIDSWAHTGGGKRYNLCAIELGPNRPSDQWMEYAVIENNVFENTEKFVEVGDYEHVIIRNNDMRTVSTATGNPRLQISHKFEHRPVKDIQIYNNYIESNEARGGTAGIFYIGYYDYLPYEGRISHEDIYIGHNRIKITAGNDVRLLHFGSTDRLQLSQVTSNANVMYGIAETFPLFQAGGSYTNPTETYNINEWRALTGNDRASLILTSDTTPLPGAASSAPWADATPILVDYEGAKALDGSGLKAVHLWVRKDDAPWTPTGLSSTADKGTFLYTGVTGDGDYCFATQAEDNSGNLSPAPTGMGHTTTTFWAVTATDTASPVAGIAKAPAAACFTPIPISYNGAYDSDSGLKAVHLWVRKDDGPWTDTGLARASYWGAFQWSGVTGDGTYYFATQSEDNAGNRSPQPTGAGDAATLFDTVPPVAGVLTGPSLSKAAPISISYSGASDNSSGLYSVTLWVKKGTGSWAKSSLISTTDSGTFSYSPSGTAVYYFDLVAVDKAGVSSTLPTGTGQGSVSYDATAPIAGTVSAPASATQVPIAVEYSGASDANSGLKAVYLWYKKGAAGAWTPAGQSSAAAAGSFPFAAVSGSDTYYFAVQSEDVAGNTSPAPTGDGLVGTAYNSSFSAGVASSPAYDSAAPIEVTYTGAEAGSTAISKVWLWSKKGIDGVWTDSGLSGPAPSGSFTFAPSGDGTYFFATQAESTTGDRTPAPYGGGHSATIFDTTAPVPGTPAAPAMVKTAPITVSYAGASDDGSGLSTVMLWIKKGTGAWVDSGLAQAGATGAFQYNPASGSGTYAFALVARDAAGVTSAAPTAAGATTVYDVDAPNAGSVAAPANVGQSAVTLSYSGASDAHSGLKSVCLWFKKGTTGTWTQTALSGTGASGSFSFSGFSGPDTYFFATRAEDNAGNLSAQPSGSGTASTVFQGALSPGVAASPPYATAAPINVTYSGASTTDAGLKAVHLWYKKGAAGAWADTGLTAATSSGSFAFTAVAGDDAYYFATQAENNAGTLSAAPSGDGHTRTVYDTAKPAPGSITATALTNQTPVVLTYSGAADAGSGLKSIALWVKKDAGSWTNTGLAGSAASGTFSYSPQASGKYHFALVATDNAGLASDAPAGDGMALTTYDVDPPLASTVTAPATANIKPIHITYSGVTDALSGVKTVRLWVRKDAGNWSATSLSSAGESGSFDFADVTGGGTYYFGLVAEDNAGNVSAAPTGAGKAQTVYTRALNPGTLTAPTYAGMTPVALAYSGASDSGGTTVKAHLWYKKGAMGAWADSGVVAIGASGALAFGAISGDGTYYFALQIETADGEKSAAPSGNGAASTIYDTTAPNPGTIQAPRSVNRMPLTITYTGVTDAGSGIKQVILWMKEGKSGTWSDTGMRSTVAPSGTFEVNGLNRDGRYYFFIQAEDKAGLKSASPADAAVFR